MIADDLHATCCSWCIRAETKYFPPGLNAHRLIGFGNKATDALRGGSSKMFLHWADDPTFVAFLAVVSNLFFSSLVRRVRLDPRDTRRGGPRRPNRKVSSPALPLGLWQRRRRLIAPAKLLRRAMQNVACEKTEDASHRTSFCPSSTDIKAPENCLHGTSAVDTGVGGAHQIQRCRQVVVESGMEGSMEASPPTHHHPPPPTIRTAARNPHHRSLLEALSLGIFTDP
ncbi:hypothetical protein BKA65DRAFT_572988 [Rhexocercosporidium sp. MPI-PUGE-AT-0058]|nr:hypothetical protein BKA65DRAFT_572988 [Rhexocercosporidium sp. MPI-PUGE-AT-0058]